MERINFRKGLQPISTATFTDSDGVCRGIAFFYSWGEVQKYRELVKQMNLPDESRPVLNLVAKRALLKRTQA